MKNVWTESLQLALSPAEPLKPSEDAGRGAALMAHLFVSVHAHAPADKRLLYINNISKCA